MRRIRLLASGLLLPFALSVGCALVGFDFKGYGTAGTGAGGSGGGAGGTPLTTTGVVATAGPGPGPGGSSVIASGPGSSGSAGGGSGGEASTGTAIATSSTVSAGGSCVPPDCADRDACTADVCVNGVCTHPSIDLDDGNGCTEDTCKPLFGPIHTPIAGCCAHSVCTASFDPLDASSCNFPDLPTDCVSEICGTMPTCCSVDWDATCVKYAQKYCASNIGSVSCACSHSYCTQGPLLSPDCDPCVHAVCSDRSSCCKTAWDATCVELVTKICHVPSGPECQ